MFDRISKGIARTRDSLVAGIRAISGSRSGLDNDAKDALETSLLLADCGVDATLEIVAATDARLKNDGGEVVDAVREEVAGLLGGAEQSIDLSTAQGEPFVILVVGVNGAGKTTSIAKMGRYFRDRGHSVMFAAGDTFRAAAVDQLKRWGERLDIPVISQDTGADPASVIFDACAAAKSRAIDILIADTAGRLQTQDNLMAELEKIKRVIRKHNPQAPHETLLIIDATMGQNALSQARLFHDKVALDSLVVTKLDGTAKGGILLALVRNLALPIRFIGVGESFDDLQEFSAEEFATALFSDVEID